MSRRYSDFQMMMGIDKYYHQYRLKDSFERSDRYKKFLPYVKTLITESFKEGKYILLIGDGDAKNKIAAAILTEWAKIYKTKAKGRFTCPKELIKYYSPRSDEDEELDKDFSEFEQCDFITICDIVNERYSSNAQKIYFTTMLEDLIHERRNNFLGGVITSNIQLRGNYSIESNLGKRFANTLEDLCLIGYTVR